MATRALASRQMRAAARSSGPARCARTPHWAPAERWSPSGPSASKAPPHRQRRGVSGRAGRSLRSRRTRNSSFGIARSGPHGVTVSAQLAPGPLWDSSSVRDAESKSEKASRTRACQQRLRHRAASRVWFARGGRRPPRGPRGSHPVLALPKSALGTLVRRGTARPARLPARWAVLRGHQCSEGAAPIHSASVPGWLSRRAVTVSAQEAQYAAYRFSA